MLDHLDRLGVQALSTAMIAQLVAGLMSHTVSAIAPEITRTLHFSSSFIGIYTSCIYLGACLSSLVSGTFIRKYGPARITEYCLLAYAVSLLLCFADWSTIIIGSGLLLGLGKGAVQPAVNTMVSHHTQKSHLNFIFSIKQTAEPIGIALAGILIPYIAIHYDWQVALTFAAVIGAAGAYWCLTVRPDQDTYIDKNEKITPKSLQESFRLVISSPALMKLAFLSICYKGLATTALAYLVTYLVHRDFTLLFAGYALSVSTVGMFAGRLFWGWLADKINSSKAVLAFCGILMGLSTIALAQIEPHSSKALIVCIVFLLGFSSKGWSGVYSAQVALHAPEGRVSEATGGADFFEDIGAIIIPVLFGLLVTHWDKDYHLTFYLVAATTIVTGCLLIFLKKPIHLHHKEAQ
ncbi:MAG: MFS transporter [Burkholderiales bacterium]|nr:MFS transporter [Burkholderiales bacterium]